MSLKRLIGVEIEKAELAANDDFVTIFGGSLGRVRAQLDALFGDSC